MSIGIVHKRKTAISRQVALCADIRRGGNVMANKNSNLGAAKSEKKDEFYTQLTDIEKELRHYRQHFRDKTVLCNCDDPF